MLHTIKSLKIFKGIFIITCFLLAAPALGQDKHFETGIAITPRYFPQHSLQDIDDALNLARGLGKYAVLIYQWHDLNLDTVSIMVEKSRQAKLIPIIGLSPTMLDQGRKELDLPDKLRASASPAISFSNPVIRKEFILTAEKLAQLKPEYLCLATEINFLALQQLDEFLHFATLYKEAYAKAYEAFRAIKRKTSH